MGDLSSQQKVLKQKTHIIGGRECNVKIPFTKNALSSKVFVGRIKEGTTTMELRNFFTEEAHKLDAESTVTDVYIPRPFRSFAFVTFSSPAVAKEIIKKAEFTLGATSIYVSSAHSTRPQTNQQDGINQIQQFQQNRSNSFQMPSVDSRTLHQNSNNPEEMFYNEWYGNRNVGERKGNIAVVQNTTGINPNRVAGPMFLGTAYQHPPPPLPPYTGTPPAAPGNQMLNQLETLNLNNMGIGHEVVNAIKAIFSVAQTAGTQQIPQQKPIGNAAIPIQSQQFPYQSLSPSLPTNSGSSPSRVYIPPSSHSSNQQGRRNGGESSSNNSGGSGWR